MNNLVYELICEIGLGFEGGYMIDQDYGNMIYFNKKMVRYSENLESLLLTREDMIFDPLNAKFMNVLFSYYLNKLNNLEGRYFPLYYPVATQDGKGFIEVRTKDNSETYKSNNYYNEAIRLYDLIFKLNGSECPIDLNIIDKELYQDGFNFK